MILVLAGNYSEARDWMQTHLDIQTRYIKDRYTLIGIERKKHNYVKIGSWDTRTDLERIEQEILIRDLTEYEN